MVRNVRWFSAGKCILGGVVVTFKAKSTICVVAFIHATLKVLTLLHNELEEDIM